MNEKKLGTPIDLSLCIGCNACTVACKRENDVPLGAFNTWIESFDVERPDGRIARANVPKQCNHCADAPCVKVCPTGASYRAEDGTVQIDQDRCIGCKYCMAACPYQVRYQVETGEVQKCTFCHHRTGVGLAARLRGHVRGLRPHLRRPERPGERHREAPGRGERRRRPVRGPGGLTPRCTISDSRKPRPCRSRPPSTAAATS